MSDDFGTVNVRGGERGREIDVLRQHYRRHRDALQRMIADAPTEILAGEYARLAQEIDRAVSKLDEIEGLTPPTPPLAPMAASRATIPAASPAPPIPASHLAPHGDPMRSPGERTLQPTPGAAFEDPNETLDQLPRREERDGGGSRVLMILGAALVALLLIGGLIWKASSGRSGSEAEAVETVQTIEPAIEPEPEPVLAAEPLDVTPAPHDYGVIRKGTRATRRFEVTNTTDEPVTIQLARSACRCLYYDYDNLIAPKAKQSVVVTVDGAKAPAGPLKESVKVTAKSDPSITGTLQLVAEIQ